MLDNKDILREIVRRTTKPSTVSENPNKRRYHYVEALFPEQKRFVLDSSKNKAAKCGRRSGKTWGDAAYLIYEAERWNHCDVAYITLTRQNAKKILWKKLKWLNQFYRLGISFNNSELTAMTKNGSTIHCFGAHDQDDIEKLRGYAFKVVIVDESQSFGPHLEEMLDDVLEPTLLDHDGTIAMTGTPNAACVGRFHDVTTGIIKGWSTHEWTFVQNLHLKNAKARIQKMIDGRGWTWDHPVIQREYLGKWIRSLDQMVYRFREEKNVVHSVSKRLLDDLYYVLSVDLGYNDATAFTVGGFHDVDPNYYVVEGFKRVGMLPHQVAAKIKEFQDRYEFCKIVADTGGLGKMIVEEIVQRYGIPVEPAEKKSKNDFIEIVNADLEQGRIKILLDGTPQTEELKELCSQLSVLQWDDKRKKEDPRYQNDFADSFLYGCRESKHYASETPAAVIGPNDPEWGDEYEKREVERALRREQSEWHEYDEEEFD